MAARLSPDPAMVEMLLDRLDGTPSGYTASGRPASSAAMNPNPDVLRTVLDRGFDVNFRPRVSGVYSPLGSALRFNSNQDVLSLLLERGADISEKTSTGTSALHIAALNRNPEFIALLLAEGMDIEATTEGGFTPLDWAVETFAGREGRSLLPVIELLLERGAKVDTKLKLR